MAVDQEEIDAVAEALGESVAELLGEHQETIVALLDRGDGAKMKAIFDAVREALGEVRVHEDQRAWNEDVRAFAVALIASDMGKGVQSSGDAGIVVTAAINMANRVQDIRKRQRDQKPE